MKGVTHNDKKFSSYREAARCVSLNISVTHSGLLKATGYSTIRSVAYEFLLAFHSNYGLILYHLRDKARYWSKIAIYFHSPLAFDDDPVRSCPME